MCGTCLDPDVNRVTARKTLETPEETRALI